MPLRPTSINRRRILHDGSIYLYQRAGGVNEYHARLLDLLSDRYHMSLACNWRREVNFPLSPLVRLHYFQRFGFRPGFLSYWLERLYFRRLFRQGKYDLVHTSIYSENLAMLPLATIPKPVVVTFHDMIEEKIGGVDPTGIRSRQKAECVKRASALICVSQNTKKDLLETFPEAEGKINVIANGCDLIVPEDCAEGKAPEDGLYFLYVGGRNPHYKNFEFLLKASASLLKAQGIQLIVCGSAFTGEEKRCIQELHLDDLVMEKVFPSNDELALLYQGSLALVYPSRYEGFGIPALEALRCGTLVIAADATSLPEILAGHGLLFNPEDPDSLHERMDAVANGSVDRESLIRRGQAHAMRFTWEKTAQATAAVYEHVLRKEGKS